MFMLLSLLLLSFEQAMNCSTSDRMVSLSCDGAVVSRVPLSAFSGWQHPFVAPLFLSRLATYCRRAAFDSGWLDPEGAIFSVSSATLTRSVMRKDDAAAQEGARSSTVFVVAMDIQLPHESRNLVLNNLMTCTSRLKVLSVGNSSFAVVGTFSADLTKSSKETLLGVVQLSYVHVDTKSRRPVPLPSSVREQLEHGSTDGAVLDGFSKIERLPLKDLAAEHKSSPLLHSHAFMLRPSDFDFNLHLNQSMYQSFAIDTVKEAVFTWITSPVLPAPSQQVLVQLVCGDAPFEQTIDCKKRGPVLLQLDAAISRLQIEYAKEIAWAACDLQVDVNVSPVLRSHDDVAVEIFFTVCCQGSMNASGILTLRP